MIRRDRSDIRIGNLQKKHGFPRGTFRNDDGRKTRKDKMLGTVRKEREK